MRSFFSCSLYILCLCAPLWAQQDPSVYLQQAKQQQNLNSDDKALLIYNDGLKHHPNHAQLRFERGELYFSKQIYRKALHDFLQAQKAGYGDVYKLYSNIAEIYNIEGQYEKAKHYYELLWQTYPEKEWIIANLLWFCYKTLHLGEGIDLGKQALQQWPHSILLHTMMALLYSGQYRYTQACAHYETAVQCSLDENDVTATIQILYNYAISEGTFYQFAHAEQLLQKAITLGSYSSNYRLLGEFALKKLDYTAAKHWLDTSEAQELQDVQHENAERTPLGRGGLVELYLTFYQLDKAKQLLDDLAKQTQTKWLTSVSATKDSYRAWLYALYADLWDKYYRVSKKEITTGSWHWCKQHGFRLKAQFLHFYYHSLAQSLQLRLANQFMREQLLLPAYQHYLMLAQPHPALKRHFIKLNSDIELAFAPQAQAFYTAQQALLQNDAHLRDVALSQFDPLYEKDKKQLLLEHWVQKHPRSHKNYPCLIALYALNPAAVRGYGLPTALNIQGDALYTKPLNKFLRQNLIVTTQTPYRLTLSLEQGAAQLSLFNNETQVLSATLQFHASRKGLVHLANNILNCLYAQQR